jgi:hypothetical protein
LDDVLTLQHDLEAACAPDVLQAYGITLTESDVTEVPKANRYYKGEGFEYFLVRFPGVPMDRSGPQQALSGWPDLPVESVLEGLVSKLLTPKL